MRFTRLAFTAAVTLVAAVSGCSDPVPPSPQGAFYANFQPVIGGQTCRIVGHDVAVGSISSTKRDKVLVNGNENTEVSCSVIGSDKFDVTGAISQGGDQITINIEGLTTAATEAQPALGTAGFVSVKTVDPYSSTEKDNPCQFYFKPGGEGVSAGRIWVSFKCPVMTDASTSSTCQLKESVAIFENCTQ